jgi:sirohydrochlorin ferrochelatase
MIPSLLLVAHGSADPAATATVQAVAARLARLRPGLGCAVGFLERAEPTAAAALAALPHPVVAVPYLLAAAFHARVDVAGLGADAVADVLGADPALLVVAADRLADSDGPVVLAAAGTSVAAANDETRRFGGMLATHLGRPVTTAFATAAEPSLEDTVGPGRVVLPWLLAPGAFADRVAAVAAAQGARAVPVIGDHPVVASLLLARYDAAAAKAS